MKKHNKENILQDFFITKPTGFGSQLKMSLSYDNIKAHGGEIRVNTKENEVLPAGHANREDRIDKQKQISAN